MPLGLPETIPERTLMGLFVAGGGFAEAALAPVAGRFFGTGGGSISAVDLPWLKPLPPPDLDADDAVATVEGPTVDALRYNGVVKPLAPLDAAWRIFAAAAGEAGCCSESTSIALSDLASSLSESLLSESRGPSRLNPRLVFGREGVGALSFSSASDSVDREEVVEVL